MIRQCYVLELLPQEKAIISNIWVDKLVEICTGGMEIYYLGRLIIHLYNNNRIHTKHIMSHWHIMCQCKHMEGYGSTWNR